MSEHRTVDFPPNEQTEVSWMLQDWINTQMNLMCQQAEDYLAEHPDRPGVIIEPHILLPDGRTIVSEPITFKRKQADPSE